MGASELRGSPQKHKSSLIHAERIILIFTETTTISMELANSNLSKSDDTRKYRKICHYHRRNPEYMSRKQFEHSILRKRLNSKIYVYTNVLITPCNMTQRTPHCTLNYLFEKYPESQL